MHRNGLLKKAIIGLLLLLSAKVFGEDVLFFEAKDDGYGRATTFQVVLGDVDGDGDLDAVFANQGSFPSRVLLNNGAGQFTYTEQLLTGNGHGAGLADLDGDGDLDLFITCAYAFGISKPSRVYFNDGTGTFTDSGQDLGDTALSGNLVQLVDIDHDGDVDAFVAYLTVPGMDFISHVYLNDGMGTFSLSDYAFAYGTLFEDLDGDGDVDAFIKQTGIGYAVQMNDGAGTFAETWQYEDTVTSYEPWNAVFGDFDKDGTIDILDANGSATTAGPTRLFLNDGHEGYQVTDPGIPDAKAAWPVVADFNRDGHLDVFLSLTSDFDQLWLGVGSGHFIDSGVRLGRADSRGAAAGDVDSDGDLDLFVPVYGFVGGPNRLWLNVFGE
ncbi:VCBS repeat-containing protein [Candidatus Bipolaricaulota bacterium]|nr:VCBS repeat-containing protein [Candidatus Bipolaricaulota bacterium]